MTYSKKQMQPLIDKYQINPETNKLFASIVEMFDGQPNYQVWAVKVVFSQAADFNQLILIHDWVSKNQSSVKLLSKQNIVSYSKKGDIASLINEMNTLDDLHVVKSTVSMFNTDQRKLLMSNIFGSEEPKVEELIKNTKFKKWAEKLRKFNKTSFDHRKKFFTLVSSMRNISDLENAINNCLTEKYHWDKEDMLAFASNNCPNEFNVIYDKGDDVILHIKNYHASEKICGGGRTTWCITKQSSYFNDYVREGNSQYFYFDFSRKETDCFAHVGFTMKNGSGVVYAQTCDNHDMIHGYTQGKETVSIQDIFNKLGIDNSYFMRLTSKPSYDWCLEGVLKICATHKDLYTVNYNEGNKLIIGTRADCINQFVGYTFIKQNSLVNGNDSKVFLAFDFDKKCDDSKAIVAMSYKKDPYGTLSLYKVVDVFNADITKNNYLESIGIKEADYLHQDDIDPSVLLHKYIDTDNEKAALELLEKEGAKVNVNYEFESRTPIFSAIAHNMVKVFSKIVNTKGFDFSVKDGFGETILGSLLYLYASGEVDITKEEEKELENLMVPFLTSKYVDLNITNINDDSIINLACEYPKAVWLVKILASRKDVNVNIVNDINWTSLGNCIRKQNLEALRIIGQRPDLEVRDCDKEEAKKRGIDLSQFIKPTESIFGKYDYMVGEKTTTAESEMEAAMAMAMG